MNDVAVTNLGHELLPRKGGFTQDTVSTAAKTLVDISPLIEAGALGNESSHYVAVTIEVSDVRVRSDGTAPTATVGRLLYAGKTYRFTRFEANQTSFFLDDAAARRDRPSAGRD